MKKNITDYEASILYYLIEKLEISHEDFIHWAYAQYENDGVLPWIESATLTISLSEVKDLLIDKFSISLDSISSFIVGEIAYKYRTGILSDYEAVKKLYHNCDDADWSAEEKDKIYIMDDYYDWHKNPSSVVIPMLEEFFPKYELIYRKQIEIFKCQG